jgi:hypothetical protein
MCSVKVGQFTVCLASRRRPAGGAIVCRAVWDKHWQAYNEGFDSIRLVRPLLWVALFTHIETSMPTMKAVSASVMAFIVGMPVFMLVNNDVVPRHRTRCSEIAPKRCVTRRVMCQWGNMVWELAVLQWLPGGGEGCRMMPEVGMHQHEVCLLGKSVCAAYAHGWGAPLHVFVTIEHGGGHVNGCSLSVSLPQHAMPNCRHIAACISAPVTGSRQQQHCTPCFGDLYRHMLAEFAAVCRCLRRPAGCFWTCSLCFYSAGCTARCSVAVVPPLPPLPLACPAILPHVLPPIQRLYCQYSPQLSRPPVLLCALQVSQARHVQQWFKTHYVL